MTMKPEFTMQINLGTLVPIGIAILGLASWTGSLGSKVESLSTDLETVQQTVQGYDARLRAIETVQTGVNVRLDNISSSILEMKGDIKETNRLLRERELNRGSP